MGYIRQNKLRHLKEYKYSGVDRSLLSRYVLKPFYTNVAIKLFPVSMAPNLITLTGFSFVIINFLTLLWYNPTLDQDCPPWVYVSWAVGLFLYQTFDAVDGTQARRTHQSGPLGELFDHGVDACNTTLEVMLFAGVMNLGQDWLTVLTLFGALVTFYVQTWEEYHTHTLTLGVISGPVEGILTLVFVFAVTAFLGGAHVWQQSALKTLGIPKYGFIPQELYDLPFTLWYMFYGGVVLVYNTVSSCKLVARSRQSRNEPVGPAMQGLVPIVSSWALITLYLLLQPDILHHHLVPFAFYVGLMNAYAVGQIITAHLVKSEFPYHNVLVWPLAAAVIDSLGPWLTHYLGVGWPSALGQASLNEGDDGNGTAGGVYQVAFVFMCLGLAMGVYGSFVIDVIFAICDYLDIWCLTIKHPYVPTAEDGRGTATSSNTDLKKNR